MKKQHHKTLAMALTCFAMFMVMASLCPSRANSASVGEVVLGYFRDRGNDLLDMFRFRISAAKEAKGFGFHARVTCLAQVGAMYFEGEHFGMDRRAIGVWREERLAGGLSALYFTDIVSDAVYGNRFTNTDDLWSERKERGIVRNNVYWDDGRHHPLSIGAEIQAGLLPGIDIGIYPTEIADFFAGIFTLDPWNDDLLRIETLRPSPHRTAPKAQTIQELEAEISRYEQMLQEEKQPPEPEIAPEIEE